MSEIIRFGVSLEKNLLQRFDRLIRGKKYTNRSEAIRDLIRQEMVKKEWEEGGEVAGAITFIYDHHKRDLLNRIMDLQHDYQKIIISTQHIHLDHDNCLEIVAVKRGCRRGSRAGRRPEGPQGRAERHAEHDRHRERVRSEICPKSFSAERAAAARAHCLPFLRYILAKHHDVLVVDADESNPGLARMMGLDAPRQTLMENLGGKTAFRRSMGKKTAALEEKDLLGGALRSMAALPSSASSRSGRLTLVSVGKIEHTHEGCACPMGVLARTFIGNISIQPGQWVLIDTEAGVEHFGRGILEGVDAVVAIADPSYDAVMLIAKIKAMADEGGKRLCVVLNKTDGDTESLMRTHLEGQGIRIAATLPQSRDITAGNLRALPLDVDPFRENLRALLEAMETSKP